MITGEGWSIVPQSRVARVPGPASPAVWASRAGAGRGGLRQAAHATVIRVLLAGHSDVRHARGAIILPGREGLGAVQAIIAVARGQLGMHIVMLPELSARWRTGAAALEASISVDVLAGVPTLGYRRGEEFIPRNTLWWAQPRLGLAILVGSP